MLQAYVNSLQKPCLSYNYLDPTKTHKCDIYQNVVLYQTALYCWIEVPVVAASVVSNPSHLQTNHLLVVDPLV